MTVKTAVSFTDKHHEFAKRKVAEGACASVSSLVAQGIEKIIQEEAEQEVALDAMADAIKARMAAPRSAYVEMDDTDTLFQDLKDRLRARS